MKFFYQISRDIITQNNLQEKAKQENKIPWSFQKRNILCTKYLKHFSPRNSTITYFYKDISVNFSQRYNGWYRRARKSVKKSINFCHVCLHGTSRIQAALSWNLIFNYFSKTCLENSSSDKQHKDSGRLHKDKYTFLITSPSFLSTIKKSLKGVLEKIETHVLCSKPFFKYRTIYDIIWKNVSQRVMLNMTIWRMYIACWIT